MKIEINRYIALVLVNIAIIALVAFVVYYTHEVWALLGLIFLFGSHKDSDGEDVEA